jgi:hypothetical protein
MGLSWEDANVVRWCQKSRNIIGLVIKAQVLQAGSPWSQVISVLLKRMACSSVYMVDNTPIMYL